MSTPPFTSLIPAAGPVDVPELVAGLELRHPAEVPRPYTVVNFVASTDGRATFQGRSGTLSDAGDRLLFHALRERVDAVVAGTTTLAAERYGRMVRDPERRARRLAAGRAAEPLAVMVSRRGDFPLEIPLFAEAEARVVVFAPAHPNLDGVAASVKFEPLRPGPGHTPALAEAMAVLRRDHGVETLLCEGGPTLFGALLGVGAVDELFLTLAPALTGGDSGPSITAGPPLEALRPLRIAGVLQHDQTLYMRYAVST